MVFLTYAVMPEEDGGWKVIGLQQILSRHPTCIEAGQAAAILARRSVAAGEAAQVIIQDVSGRLHSDVFRPHEQAA